MILRNARLIDGSGRVWDCADIAIAAGRFESITSKDAPCPVHAGEMDLGGKTVIPGLINCHVHVCLQPGADPWALWDSRTLTENVVIAAQQVVGMLRAGITTARDLGGIAGVDLGLKRAVANGLLQGPRLLVSGSFLIMTGGHGHSHGGLEVDGADEARKGARRQIKAGADVIKVMATGGVMTAGVEPGAAQLGYDELAAAVVEAHNAGRTVATHAQGTTGIINALRADVDSIEHGFYLNEEAIALMLERGVTFVPTLSALYRIIEHGEKGGVQSFMVEKARRAVDAQWASVRRAHRAGVQIAAGNDGGSPFNAQNDLATELQLLVQAGLSPEEALAAATSQAAALLGLSDEIGTVEPGKRADLVVLDGDPLAEIEAVRRVHLAVHDGRVV